MPIKEVSEKPWKNHGVKISPFLYIGKSLRIEDLQKSLRMLQFPQGFFSDQDLSGAYRDQTLNPCHMNILAF